LGFALKAIPIPAAANINKSFAPSPTERIFIFGLLIDISFFLFFIILFFYYFLLI